MERKDGIKKFHEIIDCADDEKAIEYDEKLNKRVFFRLISRSARHLAYTYPKKIKRYQSNAFSREVPAENLIFPELDAYFSANGQNSGVKTDFGIEYYNWPDIDIGGFRKKIVTLDEATIVSIRYTGVEDKVCGFSLRFDALDKPPNRLRYYWPVHKDKWDSKIGSYKRLLEVRDLQSFWKATESFLEEHDPVYLQEDLREQVLYAG